MEIQTPFAFFRDTDGTPLDGGYVYLGVENQEPITNPVNVYWDEARTILAAQPIRTLGGYPVRAGAPAKVYTSGSYSICVKNNNGEIIVSAVSSGSLEALLADATSAAKGAGMVGYAYALAYAAGTVGKAVKDVMDRATAVEGRATAVEGRATALEATDTLDLLKHQIQTITATVASSALTVGLAPTILDFRSATLGSGVVNTRTLTAAASIVVPSTATLGTVNAVRSRIVVLAIDNAGTIEAAVVNLAGGNNLDETTLISTTAMSASADAANVVYSTTARTNLPFRVVGYVESTQTTAGIWAAAPSTIQGAGGQALSALSGLGYGQTWQDVTASRVVGTTYYNTTGRPIVVAVRATEHSGSDTANNVLQIDGVVVSKVGVSDHSAVGVRSAIVPPGSSYLVPTTTNETINAWMELR